MADPGQRASSSGSSLLLSVFGGAVLGAAGLGWWLLSEAEKRRQGRRMDAPRRLSPPLRTTSSPNLNAAAVTPLSTPGPIDSQLQDRVHQLNKAIDEVRRQLEQLQPLP